MGVKKLLIVIIASFLYSCNYSTGKFSKEDRSIIKRSQEVLDSIFSNLGNLNEKSPRKFVSAIQKAKDRHNRFWSTTGEVDLLISLNANYYLLEKKRKYQNVNKEKFKEDRFYLNVIEAPLREQDYEINDHYLYYPSYAKLVNNKFINLSELRSNPGAIYNTVKAIKKIKGQDIKNGVISRLQYRMLPGYKELDFAYNSIINISTDRDFKNKIFRMYKGLKRVGKGKPSPAFRFKNISNELKSLENYRGKYVYIDLWATWCKPCIAMFPTLKELDKEYKEEVYFVSISIDTEQRYDEWKSMVSKFKDTENHLFANGLSSSFTKDYFINGVPRFIVLDKEGMIISANAMRPTNPDFRNYLNDIINPKSVQ